MPNPYDHDLPTDAQIDDWEKEAMGIYLAHLNRISRRPPSLDTRHVVRYNARILGLVALVRQQRRDLDVYAAEKASTR